MHCVGAINSSRRKVPFMRWTLVVGAQAAVVLDPYAKAVVGRRRFGELGPVRPSPHCQMKDSH